METEHDRVQEALAARALRALGEDEDEAAEALIRTHLPSCPECRAAMEDFERVAGELALASPSKRPPGEVLARLHRGVAPERRSGFGGFAAALTATAVVIALGLGAWSVHLTGRISKAERQQANTAELISAVSVPSSKIVPLALPGSASATAPVAAVYVPGRAHLFVVGNLPLPRPDRVYQVWLGKEGRFASGGTFVPDHTGVVMVRVPADGAAYDHVLITEEPGNGSASPSGERVAESDL
jgi:hypothetical protein